MKEISEHKRVKHALRRSKEKDKLTFINISDIFCTLDSDLIISSVSPNIEKILGYKVDELINRPFPDLNLLTPESLKKAVSDAIQVLSGEQIAASVYEFIAKDGTKRFGEVSGSPQIHKGKIIGINSVARDVTERIQAEAALRQSEERLRQMADATFEGILIHDRGVILDVNRSLLQMTGYDYDEAIGKSLIDFIASESRESILKRIEYQFDDSPYEVLICRKNGTNLIVEVRAKAILHKGDTARVVAIRDITKSKQAEEALRESETRYRTLFENSGTGIVIIDKDGVYQLINNVAAGFMGARPEEIVGKSMFDFLPAETAQRYLQHNLQIIESGHGLVYEDTFKLATGERTFLITDQCVKDAQGRIVLQSSSIDMTKQKQAENMLRKAYAYNRSLIEASLDPLVTIGPDGKITDVNAATEKVTGCSRRELIGTDFSDYFTDPVNAQAGYEQVFRDGQVRDYGLELRHRDGSVISVLYNASLYRDESGQVIGVFAAARDITERRKMEEDLILKQFTVDNAPYSIVWITQEACYFNVNEITCRSLGYSREELLSMTIFDVDTDFSKNQWPRLWEEMKKESPMTFESHHRRKDGSVFPVEITASYIMVGGKGYLLGIAKDITERKQAEEALLKSEEQYRSLVESTEDPIYLLDRDLRYLFANTTYLERIGLSLRQLVGKSYNELHPILNDTFSEYVSRVFETGESAEFEYTSFRDNKPFLRTLSPVRGKQGETIAVTVISKDVTSLKKVENDLQMHQEKLRNLMGRIQAAREEERIMIAREIHDELGGALTGLKIDLSYLAGTLPEMRDTAQKNSFVNKLNNMMKLIDETIHTVRRIITDIRPSILDDFGLIAAIEWQVLEFQKRTGIECEFISALEDITLDEKHSTAVFRILQESLNNVVRHAAATKVSVNLYAEANHLILKIADNGRGITAEKVSDPKSLGLLGMRERAFFLGGTVSFSGAQWGGTTVSVEIPLDI